MTSLEIMVAARKLIAGEDALAMGARHDCGEGAYCTKLKAKVA